MIGCKRSLGWTFILSTRISISCSRFFFCFLPSNPSTAYLFGSFTSSLISDFTTPAPVLPVSQPFSYHTICLRIYPSHWSLTKYSFENVPNLMIIILICCWFRLIVWLDSIVTTQTNGIGCEWVYFNKHAHSATVSWRTRNAKQTELIYYYDYYVERLNGRGSQTHNTKRYSYNIG